MKGTYKGYDPKLGKKFAEESGGFVIGVAHLSPRKSEAQVLREFREENGRNPSDQEMFDAMQVSASSARHAANDPDKAPLQERFKQMTPQQMGKLFDDLL